MARLRNFGRRLLIPNDRPERKREKARDQAIKAMRREVNRAKNR